MLTNSFYNFKVIKLFLLFLVLIFISGCKNIFIQNNKFLNRPNILAISKDYSKFFIYDSRKFRILISDLDLNYISEIKLPAGTYLWGLDTSEKGELFAVYKYFKEYSDSFTKLDENSVTVLDCYDIKDNNHTLKKKIKWEGKFRPIHTPSDIKILDEKYLLVGDFQTSLIYKITYEGEIVNKFGGFGFENGKLYYPTSILISKKNEGTKEIFVIEAYNQRVSIFDLDGNFIRCYTGDDASKVHLNFPIFGCFDDEGKIYITELSKQQVSVFSPDFKFITSFSPLIQGFDEPFVELFSICYIPKKEEVYVVDSINRCLHIFSKDGKYKKFITELN